MKRESSGPVLTTVFVDYDNIYLSLKRKNEEAAKRFSKDSAIWLQGIASGELITPTSPYSLAAERRIVMNRCYGNPVPRRNAHDNSTDMNSFPFIRHHYLRSGFEVIDCPPLTAQLKNSADIRMVMDIRDILNHDTYFDEFIILSGDADFTPLLHRLRAHARRTVVFANDHTAQPYTAISDGEIRESSLIALLTSGRAIGSEPARDISAAPTASLIDVEAAKKSILHEVVDYVRASPQAVPLETLADRSVRIIGRDRTIGTNWGGYGSFRDLLLADLPQDIHLSDTPPYTVFNADRHISATGLIAGPTPTPTMPPSSELRRREMTGGPMASAPPATQSPMTPPVATRPAPSQSMPSQMPSRPLTPTVPPPSRYMAPPSSTAAPSQSGAPMQQTGRAPQRTAPPMPLSEEAPQLQRRAPAPAAPPPAPYGAESRREAPRSSAGPQAPMTTQPRTSDQASQIQHSIARIHDACQAPALAPAEYRVLFDVMAQEIAGHGLHGAQTLANITQRSREFGLDIKRDDLRFIFEVISEADPWFEQGASASLFAGRFRNFVVARCRSQGLSLSADELDLIEAWFSAPQQQQKSQQYARTGSPPQAAPTTQTKPTAPPSGDSWWNLEEGRQHIAEQRSTNPYDTPQGEGEEEFPRIIRSRFRG